MWEIPAVRLRKTTAWRRRIVVASLGLVALGLVAGGCAAPGASVYEAHPSMRPGATTLESLTAAERSEGSADGTAPAFAELVARALHHNPGVAAARARWRASIEAVSTAGTPPRPMLAYTWLPLPVETRVGPNEHRIGITQAIPSPFALAAQVDAAEAGAEKAHRALDRVAITLVSTIKQRAAEVRYHEQALESLRASEAVAGQLVGLASERLAAQKGALFDVTKARSELEQLRYDRIRFEELLQLARVRLNAALDRNPRAALPPVPDWPTPRFPTTLSGAPASESNDARSIEALQRRALRSDPGLLGLDATLREREARVSEARGRLFPDVTLGAQLMVNGPAEFGNPPDSGEEALGITIGLSLPLWFGADAARIDAAQSQLEAAVHEKRAYVRQLLVDIEDAALRLRAATRLVDLYDTTLLPQARQALGDAEAWRRTGAVGFTDFLDARSTLYRFELARARANADAIIAEAELERILGGPLETR